MTDVFEVAKPKAGTNALGTPVEPTPKPKAPPKPRQPPKQDIVAAADVIPVKRRRRRRVDSTDQRVDEHMLFTSLYNELKELSKGARSRLLFALSKVLT
jgi:hypothetical protein